MGKTPVQKGDTVRLDAGGAEMTVERTEGNLALCVWYAGNEPKQRGFDVTALRKLKAEDLIRRRLPFVVG